MRKKLKYYRVLYHVIYMQYFPFWMFLSLAGNAITYMCAIGVLLPYNYEMLTPLGYAVAVILGLGLFVAYPYIAVKIITRECDGIPYEYNHKAHSIEEKRDLVLKYIYGDGEKKDFRLFGGFFDEARDIAYDAVKPSTGDLTMTETGQLELK